MSLRSTSTLAALSAALVTALVTATSSAQDSPPPPPPPAAAPAPAPGPPPGPAEPVRKDGVRFRGGVALEGGGVLVPDIINLGLAGIQGQLGVQINNSFGVYLVPSFHVLFGSMGGIQVGAAAVFDYTFLDDLLTVGAGPDVASLVAFGLPTNGGIGISAAGGGLYGARLHFAVNPVVGIGDNGIRRKALSIGVDLRLYGGGAGFVSDSTNGVSAKVADFVVTPSLSIGYTAF